MEIIFFFIKYFYSLVYVFSATCVRISAISRPIFMRFSNRIKTFFFKCSIKILGTAGSGFFRDGRKQEAKVFFSALLFMHWKIVKMSHAVVWCDLILHVTFCHIMQGFVSC